jgi:hypothetical protein
MRDEDLFIVRKELVLAVYEEISMLNRHIKAHRMQAASEAVEYASRSATQVSHNTGQTSL